MKDHISVEIHIEKNTSHTLTSLRQEIDQIDNVILIALAQRKTVIEKIKSIKQEQHMEVIQPARREQVLSTLIAKGTHMGIDPNLIKGIWELIHKWSIAQQQ